MTLLTVKDLSIQYGSDQGGVLAVDRVDLTINRGEFVGLAGESGCGKTTLAMAIPNLLPKYASIVSGSVEFDGKDKNGEKVHVKYIGDPVDLSQAERVTCIGKLEGELFVTDQMLIKCPSKYEEEKKAAANEGKASK
jgi:peptide/nickel transport system ATP-binding protein